VNTVASIAVTLALALVGCDLGSKVTVYPLQRVDPDTHYGHNRMALNSTTYRINANDVVGKTAGIVTKYEDCAALNTKDWSCTYSDGSGVGRRPTRYIN